MECTLDLAATDDGLHDDTIVALRRLFAGSEPMPRMESPAPTQSASELVVGDITDTHHPDAQGRVCVRWTARDGGSREQWLECLEGMTPRIGDRVTLQQPENWPEPLITGILRRPACGEPVEATTVPAMTLTLEADRCVQIDDARGNGLLQIAASSDGPVVRLLNQNVNIEAVGKLRLCAQTLELEGGRGGVDIRTEADTVVRSRFVRLN